MSEEELDLDGQVVDERVAPFMWVSNDIVDDGHLGEMGEAIGVYLTILRFRNLNLGTAWPSAKTIAVFLKLDRKTVIKYRQKLVALGYIEPTNGGGGREYRIKDRFRSSASGASPSENKTNHTKPNPVPQLSGFSRFWDAWPDHRRKTDKAGARRSWISKGCESIADTVISAVKTFAKSEDWTKKKGEFIPAPKAWLNQCQWEGAKFIETSEAPELLGEGRALTAQDLRILRGEE